MEHIDLVERLSAKTGISYEESKIALEASGWDILDALILLEKQGKTNTGNSRSSYTTSGVTGEYKEVRATMSGSEAQKQNGLAASVKKLFSDSWLVRFNLYGKSSRRILSVPVLILILFLIFLKWVVAVLLLPLLIVLLDGGSCAFEKNDN